jgi:hypothetical protein
LDNKILKNSFIFFPPNYLHSHFFPFYFFHLLLVSCLVVASLFCYALCRFEPLPHRLVLLLQPIASSICFVITWSLLCVLPSHSSLLPHHCLHVASSLFCHYLCHYLCCCLVTTYVLPCCCLVLWLVVAHCSLVVSSRCFATPPHYLVLHHVAMTYYLVASPHYLIALSYLLTLQFVASLSCDLVFCCFVALLSLLVSISLLPPCLQGGAWKSKLSNNY